MSFDILGIESSFPKNYRKFNKDETKALKITGINKRYYTDSEEDCLSLSTKCLQKLKKKYDFSKFDFLIVVTQTSPYNFPSLSNILQNKFGLRQNIFAFDLNLGCSGYVFALKMAESLIKSENYKLGLIVCVDTYTKYISKENKSCYPIFSDGCTTTVIKSNPKKVDFKYDFGSDGSGSKDLFLKKNEKEMFMNGTSIALFTLKLIPKFFSNFVKKNKIITKNYKFFLFHQASKFVCDNIEKKLDLEKNKIFNNYNKYGNTISSSLPLLLKDLLDKNKIKKSDKLILCGFGVGLSWGILNFTV